jgi:hypothetical protein
MTGNVWRAVGTVTVLGVSFAAIAAGAMCITIAAGQLLR